MSTQARFLVITDIETTGLHPEANHEIIQIARVIYDTQARRVIPGTEYMAYVRPTFWDDRTIEAMDVNRLSSKQFLIDNGVTLSQALRGWSRGVDWRRSVVAAWGIDFESRFLASAHERAGRDILYPFQMVDLRTLAWWCIGYNEIYGLGEAAELLGVEYSEEHAHDALYDVQCEAGVLHVCMEDRLW